MSLSVISVKSEKKQAGFDLFNEILVALDKCKISIENQDILVISSKYVSTSQGRILDVNGIKPSEESIFISKKFQLKPKNAEVILRESDTVFGGIPGFVITSSDNILAPNAGIDKSNAKEGRLILYPNDSYLIAEELRRNFFLKFQINIGVLIVDSRLMPARIGTTGVAIACSGIEPVNDMRAQTDLDGNPLKVTFQAVADNIASIANHKMGEGSESKPFAIVKNSGAKFTNRKIASNEMAISNDLCVYIRGFTNSN